MEINYDICQMLDDKMMDYSSYVILHRALPSIEDGFKVSLRRILYTMHKENMTKLTKSANVSGQVMKIHPHSDCYPTIVNMVQQDNHANPFIIGKGAFAYHTSRDTQPASSRYSEVRIAPYSQDMMDGIKKNSVEMIPTFDGSSVEPTYLPTKHPNILTHCQQGMAVGMATNIPSFNLSEVCDFTIDYINDDILNFLVPDFPTGGKLIYNQSQIEKINTTGLGSVDIQATYVVDGDTIIIKEIPFVTTREVIIEKIIDLVKSGKVKEITNIIDTTDLSGMSIEIKIKKNVDADLLMQKLYRLTPLQSSFSANMNCLVNNKPQVLGASQIVGEWIKFRKQCLKRELEYDINKLEEECNKLMGLELILNDLDKAISLIRGSKTEKEAMNKLKSHFNLTDAMTEYISTIRMVNMNNEWLTSKISKLTDINNQLEVNQQNLSNDTYYTQTIIKQLQEVKAKYGKPRMTTIIHEDTVEVTNDILIPDETCAICITKDGYVKRTQRQSATHKLKDGDDVILNQSCTTKHTILLFTNKGNVHKVFVHTLDQTLPSNLGQYLYSLVQMDKDEKIISVQLTRGYKGYLINVFENNKLAKVNMSSFQTEQRRTTLKNAISLESPLVAQYVIENDIDIVVQSTIDKVLIVNTSDFNPKNTKNVAGDSLIKSKDDSVVKVTYRLSDIDTDKLDVDYYKGRRGNTGCYIKKTDTILIKS